MVAVPAIVRVLGKVASGARTVLADPGVGLSALRARLRSRAATDEEQEIEVSGLFDARYYAAQLSGETMLGLTPLRHFVSIGARRGVSPHPVFDVDWYLKSPAVGDGARSNPLLHYLRTPQAVRQSPCPLFDVPFYLQSNPDVAREGVDPLCHYLSLGGREGRAPHPLFDGSGYMAANPDVARSGENPLVHFLTFGAREGRSPHPLFDTTFYLEANADVRVRAVNPLVHYLFDGWKEGRDPSPSFHTAEYLSLHPELRESDVNPLLHYVQRYGTAARGRAGGTRRPHRVPAAASPGSRPTGPGTFARGMTREPGDEARRLFDAAYYLETNPDVRAAGVDPLAHFMAGGWRERRDPHPLFSTGFYLDSNRDVASSGENPFVHFLGRGGRAGRSPHPLFDAAYYLECNPDVRQEGVNPLVHYLEVGAAEGRQPNRWFDGDAYGWIAPDVGDRNPLLHYALTGKARGDHTHAGLRDPEAWHHDYVTFRRLVENARRCRIEGFRSSPPGIVTLRDDEVAEAAAALAFEPVEDPLVSIVIPVHNHVRLTVECLCSIRTSLGDAAIEVLVADDGSTDATPELLPLVRGVRYLRDDANVGFLLNCNRAAKRARGSFLLFLNNDAQVTPGWLKELLRVFDDEPAVGAVGPRVLYPNGRLQEAGARVLADGSTKFLGLFEDPALEAYTRVRRVDYCSGVCLLLRREVFERLGGFDEELAPAYYEDVDLCLRLQESGLDVYCNPAAVVFHHLSESSRLLPDEYKTRCVTRNRQRVLERHWDRIQALNEVKVVAFYLPQYHPIPENDRWWGKGFTEWRNVVRGRPVFEGHDQPRIPADLGFYDLRTEETVREQWTLARRYGIGAFCYYYYWFAGRRLLEEPLEMLLRTNEEKLPFCLAWANENWTRTWDGGDDRVLIGQVHGEADDRAIIQDLIRYFRDPAYLRIAGRPVFLLYRHDLLPDVRTTIGLWRDECGRAGVGDPYLVACEACDLAWVDDDPRRHGFDASVEFPPHGVGTRTSPPGRVLSPEFTGTVWDYRAAALKYATRPLPSFPRFRTVFPGWDNTARRPNDGHIFAFSSPGTYRAWLETAVEETRDQRHGEERLVFVNAWNEWAEGCYLEPDLSTGHSFLEATRAALDPRVSSTE